MKPDDRSLNEELQRGMLDGKQRFTRPNTATRFTEMDHVRELARDLHPSHYGTLGRDTSDESLLPDAEVRSRLREQGAFGY